MAANPVTLESWDTESDSLKFGETHLPDKHWVAQESWVLSAGSWSPFAWAEHPYRALG